MLKMLSDRRGHGTQVVDGKLQATVCGVIQRVNKLVSVIPLRSRYVTLFQDANLQGCSLTSKCLCPAGMDLS